MSTRAVDYFSISYNFAEMGLIVVEDHQSNEFFIVRPSSVTGTKFTGYDYENVVGINNVSIKTDAPIAKISKSGKGRKTKFRLNISVLVMGGPELVLFDEKFTSVEELVIATRECYFSNRINFNNFKTQPK